MIYVKVNDIKYPATVDGQMNDYSWDNRESKSITLTDTYDNVKTLFPDGISWCIVVETESQKYDENGNTVLDEAGNPVIVTTEEEFDNSDFSMSGPITDNRNGTCTIKMGKSTDLEDAYEMLIGG
nr:MAG TPA: hypothetical protein [Caudoviricetes sp.]